ncbi:MAG: hypothetical protein ACR2OM_14495 [Aestuariivirgaceae bacterium]
MPLQNRVTPFGEIIADPARGTFMGNRGGRFHDPKTKTLTRRRWASRQWIICELEFKDRHRELMGNSYTVLFFLDEVTALAAGHRPCFECRRAAANAFFSAYDTFYQAFVGLPPADKRLRASEMDMLLHIERIGRDGREPLVPAECPDGTVFARDGDAWAMRNDRMLRWTPQGYDRAIPAKGINRLRVLTPMTTLCILQHGYEPIWHETADTI